MANDNNNNEQFTQLANAHNLLMNTVDPNLSLFDIRRLNNNQNEHVCDVLYLHLKIIFGGENDVDYFLHNYCNRNGIYATNVLVNYPLIDTENHVNITALDCATIWNTNVEKIRFLYKWGADISMPNVDGNYINNNNLIPYRNYLSRYVLRENIQVNNYPTIRGLRIQNQFNATCTELDYLSGEVNPPNNWIRPERIHHFQH